MNSIKYILITLIFSFGINTNYSQISFEVSFSSGRNDQARAITQAFDSGYAVVGSTVSYEGNTDVYLIKTDEQGIFSWAKRFGGIGMDWGEDIIETSDSGFAILGYGQKNGAYDMYFIKTNKYGDSTFTKFIGNPDWDFGHALKQTDDNGYILAGETFGGGISKGYLVKLDSNGTTEWTKTFGGIIQTKFEDVIVTSNGDFIVAGETQSFGNGRQAYVIRTDRLGTLIWEKNYGNPGVDFAKSITEINTGEFVFAGGTNTPPYSDIDSWAVKISSTGNIVQSRVLIDYSPTSSIIQNDDWNETVTNLNDSLVFAGQRSFDNSEPGNVYIYRYTYDLGYSGYQDDFQKFITGLLETAYDSKKTFDNGIIFACSAEKIDSNENLIYLIKLDSTMSYPHPYSNSINNQNDYTDIETIKNEKQINVYPNPSNSLSIMDLKAFNNEEVTITVFNSFGKLIMNQKTSESEYTLNLTPFDSGLYFIRVSSKEIIVTKRYILTK